MRRSQSSAFRRFFLPTKKLHNALHGAPITFTPADRQVFNEVTETNLASIDLDADIRFIRDPQPAGLIRARDGRDGHWMWRCHIDVSARVPGAWEFIAPMVEHCDLSVFSAPQFARTLPIPQVLIAPSIDPLSDKNRALTRHMRDYLQTFLFLAYGGESDVIHL